MSDEFKNRVTRICELLSFAVAKTRVLNHLRWDGSASEEFLANRVMALLVLDYYPLYHANAVRDRVFEARRLMLSSSIDQWLERQARALAAVPEC